jgi:Anti-sigma factor NepR
VVNGACCKKFRRAGTLCGNARLQTLQPALQICRVGFARSEADRLVKEGSTVEFMKDSLTHGGAKPPAKRSEDLLGPNSEIGRKLKQYYDGLVSSDVPDRFAELLSELEAAEAARKKG